MVRSIRSANLISGVGITLTLSQKCFQFTCIRVSSSSLPGLYGGDIPILFSSFSYLLLGPSEDEGAVSATISAGQLLDGSPGYLYPYFRRMYILGLAAVSYLGRHGPMHACESGHTSNMDASRRWEQINWVECVSLS